MVRNGFLLFIVIQHITASMRSTLSKKTVRDSNPFAELLLGHTIEFGMFLISLRRVQELQQLGYFGSGVGGIPRAKVVLKSNGELVVFKVFLVLIFDYLSTASWSKSWSVSGSSSTSSPNAMTTLAKFIWAEVMYVR